MKFLPDSVYLVLLYSYYNIFIIIIKSLFKDAKIRLVNLLVSLILLCQPTVKEFIITSTL